MEFILDLLALCFVYLVVYRRIIEPFTEGYRSKRKAYNMPKEGQITRRSATLHPTEVEETARPIIIEAEFTEIASESKP